MIPKEIVMDAMPKVSGISWDDITSRRRTLDLVRWRTIAVLLLRSAGLTYDTIGKMLGDRKHCDMIHLYLNGIEQVENNVVFSLMVDAMCKFILNNYGEPGRLFYVGIRIQLFDK